VRPARARTLEGNQVLMLEQDAAGAPAGSDASVEVKEIKSKYDFVMAASKEAERLNDHHRKTGAPVSAKVTVEAVKRIRRGLSRVVYEEPQGPLEETPKESTYFFGS
jgi:DNA-directed RNA polymerase subunit K/omega